VYKHLVIWKLVDRTLAPALASAAETILREMRSSLPGLLKVEIASVLGGDETAGDLVLYSEFSDKEAYLDYDHSAAHQLLKKLIGSHRRQRMGADYVVADDSDEQQPIGANKTGTGIT
jgi:Stress responsive A/B Barrel Domain